MTTPNPPELANLLLEAARAMGATVMDTLPQLTGNRFNSEVLSEAISGTTLNRHENDLPQRIAATQLDNIPVLIGALTGGPIKASLDQQLRRYRNQTTIARTWLGSEAANLQFFLIAPTGALSDPIWRQLAAEIEADDRSCRKLVWLFNGPPTLADARSFLERTFVARPWPAEQRTELLDGMANLSLPDGWEEAIEDLNLDFSGLVERLIELEREATQ